VKKDIELIKRQHRDRLNKLRCIERILDLEEFYYAWLTATPEESSNIEAMILLGRYKEIQYWLKTKSIRTLDDMTLQELRELSRKHSIRYYGNKTRDTLIWELKDAIDSDARRNDAPRPMGENRA
jgi:hypothetical protein